MTITCGIDWAEDHHDVALVDESGKLVAKRRINDDAEGLRRLLELLIEAGDTGCDPIPVAVETARGLLISCVRATGRAVYSINPMAVARYRERHRVARAKSDHADATALANILRTDADMHRPLPADSELVQAITVLARAQQDAAWNRGQLSIHGSAVDRAVARPCVSARPALTHELADEPMGRRFHSQSEGRQASGGGEARGIRSVVWCVGRSCGRLRVLVRRLGRGAATWGRRRRRPG